MNLSAFKGRVGICRLISLLAGFLVFVLIIGDQFYIAGNVFYGGAPPVNWFGLFGFIIVIFYLSQVTWAGLLIMDVRTVSEAKTVKLIDGGINGVTGGVIAFLCIWWFVLLFVTFWEVIGNLNCKDPRNCPLRTQLGFAAAAWFFAVIQGICSILLGIFLYKEIKKDDEASEETPAATAPEQLGATVSASTADAESFRTAPP